MKTELDALVFALDLLANPRPHTFRPESWSAMDEHIENHETPQPDCEFCSEVES